MDRPATQAEINAKTAQLKWMELTCKIEVLRVELVDVGEGAFAVPKAKASIALQIKGARASVMTVGEQVWERVRDRWIPDSTDAKNWRVFGNVPVAIGS